MGWINGGRPRSVHECSVPRVIRLFGFGPDEGSQYECDDCGERWELHRVRSGDTSWDWGWVKLGNFNTASGGINAQGLPVDCEVNRPRLIDGEWRHFAAAIADKIASPSQPAPHDVIMVEDALKVMQQWGYLAFPAPVAGGNVQEHSD
jgi:hypothetical protein